MKTINQYKYLAPVSKFNKDFLIEKHSKNIKILNKKLSSLSKYMPGERLTNDIGKVFDERKEILNEIQDSKDRITFYKTFYNN